MVIIVPLALLGALAVVGVAFAVGLAAARSGSRQADDRMAMALERQAAAFELQQAELAAQLGVEREQAVHSAADMAARMAGEKLGDSMASGSRILDLRTTTFEKGVASLSGQVEKLNDALVQLQQEAARQHGQLVTGIEQVTSTNRLLADTAQHLREALASPKARGQWGERMADDVLRTAGLVEGVSYRKQTAIAGGSIPDFTFFLPGDRFLHMDVKFPIDNYLRYLEAENDADREAAAKAFVRDVRGRVKELNGRSYIQADSTVDQVLLFIPNESVWGFIHERDPHLFDLAREQRVTLCSPVTLFATLAIIRQATEQSALTRTSDEILTCLGEFRQQWLKYAEAVDKVERGFSTVQKGFDDLTGTRRRQLERQLDRIDALRHQRGMPEADPLPFDVEDPADEPGFGDGEGEARRRALGDIRTWGVADAG